MGKRGFVIALEFDEPLKAMAALGGKSGADKAGGDSD
jgi:hypothetical protein